MTNMNMKNRRRTKNNVMRAEIIHRNGQLKISVVKLAKGMQAVQIPIQFKDGLASSRRNGASTPAMVVKQPEPKHPGLTKKMIREQLPGLLRDRFLTREPATMSDWLLAEWHVARKLNLPKLRLAHFVSETLHASRGVHQHPARTRSA